MTHVGQERRSPTRVNRIGYVVAVLINAAGLFVLHLWPGWRELPFLTADADSVLWVVDAALVVGILVNFVQLVRDPGWPTAAGSLVTTVVGLVAMVRILQVFPFDLSDGWATVVRVALVVGIVGSCLGILALLASLLRIRQVEGR
jgi:hypothetical protein